jgi:hypothetical protein
MGARAPLVEREWWPPPADRYCQMVESPSTSRRASTDGHGPFVVEERAPVAEIAGLATSLLVIAIGVGRLLDGAGVYVEPWLLGLVSIALWSAAKRLVLKRHWRSVYHVFGIDPDDVDKNGVYRPPPDPRRTRRQRFVDWFSGDLDRSGEAPYAGRAAYGVRAMGRVVEWLWYLAVPLVPLIMLVLGFDPMSLICWGLVGAFIATKALLARRTVPERHVD